VPDDAAEFLRGSRQEARNILERDQGNVECIAEADKPRGFYGSVNV
jgi:hypothetical protein